MEQLQKRPGLVGYIAKDGDSLWSIAKENHTTVEDIRGIITGRMRSAQRRKNSDCKESRTEQLRIVIVKY